MRADGIAASDTVKHMEPVTLLLPVGLMHAAVVTVAVCIGGRSGSARSSMVGIRLWSTMSSHGAWVAGHRAAVPWSWGLMGIGVATLVWGLVMVASDEGHTSDPTALYMTVTIAAFLLTFGIMTWRADRAAKQTLVEEHLAEEADDGTPSHGGP